MKFLLIVCLVVSAARAVVHPGTCPPNDIITTCEFTKDNCLSDAECNLDEKCCKYGCGKQCLKPEPEVDFCARALCPVDRPICDEELKTCCPPVCEQVCEFGHQRDENGCELCPCNDKPDNPCENHECSRNERCEVHRIVCVTTPCPEEYNAVCVPNTDRPGTCPKDDTITTCEIKDACLEDSNCPGRQKCCPMGCGKKCVRPIGDCDTVRCPRGSTCNPATGRCEPDFSLCAAVLCIVGSTCDPRTGRCEPLDPCSYIRCASGYRCVNGRCLPDRDNGNLCQGFPCPRGQRCELLYPPCAPEFPDNCNPVPVCRPCPSYTCPFYCPHGVSFDQDKDGCMRCLCRDPCQNVRCRPFETCQVVSGRPQCVRPTKG